MAQSDCTAKKREFQHLTSEERGQIEALRREGYGASAIARKIGRDKSTISRELKRGTVTQRQTNPHVSRNPNVPEYIVHQEYFAETGGIKYRENRRNCRKPLKMAHCADFIEHADKAMQAGFSPDAIVGRYRLEHPGEVTVCAKTLYNYVDMCLLKTRNIDLLLKVRRRPKTSRVRKNRKILGESIENRPAIVDTRERFADWEIDSVVGCSTDKTAIMTLIERRTRYQIAVKLPERTAEATKTALEGLIKEIGVENFLSITADNGSENALLKDIEGVSVYFAHPYSSFERGSNENHNGILRRTIKKGQSLDEIPAEVVQRACDWSNNLPRKILGYRTPAEAFAAALTQN